MAKEPLPQLIERGLIYLKEIKYADSTINNIKGRWNKVLAFMDKKGLELYSPEVGKSYLKEIFGDYTYEGLSKSQKMVYSTVIKLDCILEHGAFVYRQKPLNESQRVTKMGNNLFCAFIRDIGATHSPRSVDAYDYLLVGFLTFLNDRNIDVSNLTVPIALDYIKSTSSLTAYSRQNTIRTVRSFVYYLCRNGILENNNVDFWRRVLRTKVVRNKKIPSVFTEEEVEAMLNVIDRSNPVGKRNYAMALLAARYGMRVSDITGLRFCNLDWDKNLLSIVQSKTNRSQSFPLTEEIGKAIIDYIKYGRPESDEPYVFLRTLAPAKPVTKTALGCAISEYFRMAGINVGNRHHGPHSLRHSAATKLLEANEPMPIIQEFLGHSSPESTKIYLRVGIDILRQCALDIPLVSPIFYDNLYD